MTAPSPRPNGGGGSRTRAAAIGVLLAAFVAGAATGVGVEQWRRHRAFGGGHAPRAGEHGGRRGGGDPMSDRFLGRLDLAPAQRAAVDTILARRRAQLEQFWAGPGTQLRVIVDSTRNEVRAVLTPTQRATYDSMTARRARERGPGGGGPPMGPPPRPK